MAYSTGAREMILRYRDNGHSLEETKNEFGVSVSTIRDWESLRAENGSVEKRELNREATIFKSIELHAYVAENPDAFLREIAEHFGGSITGAFEALERENLTLKKRLRIRRTRRSKTRGI
jgi:transposase